MIEWFEKSCKKPDERLIGFESERFGVFLDTGKSIPYEENQISIRKVLEKLSAFHQFTLVYENDYPIGAFNDKCMVTLEPGAQFEISVNPNKNFCDLIMEFLKINNILCEIARELEFAWLACGTQPFTTNNEIKMIPKKRYLIMENYFKKKGRFANVMMKATCSIHVSIDYTSEENFSRLFRIIYALSPVFIGWFTNSCYSADLKDNNLNKRYVIWKETDKKRCGIIPGVLKGNFGFKEYIDYCINVPMMFSYGKDKNELIPRYGLNFKDFINLDIGREVNEDDFILHMSGVFPMARLRNYIEIRYFDALPLKYKFAILAIIWGLMYSEKSIKRIEKLIENVNEKRLTDGLEQASIFGFGGEYLKRSIHQWAEELYEISRDGLNDIDPEGNLGSEYALEKIDKAGLLIESKKTPSDEIIEIVKEKGFNHDTLIKFNGLRFCPEVE